MTNRPPNRRKIGMVFQSYALFPNLTVAGNIGFGLQIARKSAHEINQRVAEMLTLIHLTDFAKRYPYQLSGGQQQRVALARALAIQPQVLLLDEPLSALDAKIRLSLRQEIRTIQRQLGITTIYVTHDQEEALSLSDRVVVMHDGRVEQIGTPLEIYNSPQTPFVASFVGTLNLLRGQIVDSQRGAIEIEGQEILAPQVAAKIKTGEPVIVALRPESISLDGVSPTGNKLRGTIEDIHFLGSIVRVRVRMRQNMVSYDQFNNPNIALPKPGQAVTVTFSPDAVLVMETAIIPTG